MPHTIQTKHHHRHYTILVLLAFLTPILSTDIFVSASPSTINTYATYTFLFQDTGAYAQPGRALITFQSPPYLFSNNSNISSCVDTNRGNILNCYAASTNSIAFDWTNIPTDGATDTLSLSITLINPSYVDNFTISYSYTLSTNTLYSSTTGQIKGLSPASLASCGVVFSPTTTGTASTATISITTRNAIPTGGSIQLTITDYTIPSNTLTSTNTLTSSSVLNSAVTPSYNSQTYFYPAFVISTIPSGSPLQFSMNTILSPPTTQSNQYYFQITTSSTTNFLNQIDTRACYISGVTDSNIPTITLGGIGTMYVGNTRNPTLTIITPLALTFMTDTIRVTTHSSTTGEIEVYTGNGGLGTFNGFGTLIGISNITGGGINLPTSAVSLTAVAGGSVTLTLGLALASLVNSGTKQLFVQLFRSGSSYASGSVSFNVFPNTLTSVGCTPSSSVVSATTSYVFTMVNRNPLGVGAFFQFILPSTLSIANGACIATVSASMGGSISTTIGCSASSNTITVSTITTNPVPSGVSFTLTINNIRNPISIQPTSAIFIQTFFSTAQNINPVDNSTGLTGLTITSTIATIPSGNIIISRSDTTNIAQAVYTITYRVATRFQANGYLTLILPSFMTLQSSPTCTYSILFTNTTSTSSSSFSCSSTVGNNSVITLNMSSLVTSDLQTGTQITFVIDSIRNHFSTLPVNIQLRTFNPNGFEIQQTVLSAISITNSLTDNTLNVVSTTTNRINGNPTSSSFQLTLPAPLSSGDRISLQIQQTSNFNTQTYFLASPSCQISSVSAPCSINAANSFLLQVTVTSSLTTGSTITLVVSNIILARCFQSPASITFRSFQLNSGNFYAISSRSIVPPGNTITNRIQSISLSINNNGGSTPSLLNQLQQFSLTVTTTNRFQPGDILLLTIPQQYLYVGATVVVSNSSDLNTLTTSLCSASTALFCSNNDAATPNILRIVQKTSGNFFNNISSLTISINMGVYRSPQDWSTYNSNPFLASTSTSLGFSIDSMSPTTTNATFFLACSVNTLVHRCRTCLTNGSCLSCYQLGQGYDTTFAYSGYFFRTTDGFCVTSCSGNYYNNSNVCQLCTQPCFSCEVSSTNCTSCVNTTTPFFLLNSTCLAACPPGYYSSGLTCLLCDNNCLTCNGFGANCTSCPSGTFLTTQSNTCISSSLCEFGTYPDNLTSTCALCSVSCNGCSINATMCLSCANGYILDTSLSTVFPGQCTNICPSGTANDTLALLGGGCRCNYTVCATCQNTINRCLTCSGSLVLSGTTCVTTCGNGFYNQTGTCAGCISNCKTCVNSSSCIECNTGIRVYAGGCWSSCPVFTTSGFSGTIAICIFCGNGCNNCINSTFCDTCVSGWLLQSTTTGVQACTTTCSPGYNAYLGVRCVSVCPGLYQPINGQCILPASNQTTTATTVLASKAVPFPVSIGLAVMCIATLASKVALPKTILSAGLCAFSGLAQSLVWVIFMIVAGVEQNSSTPLTSSGIFVVLAAFLINVVLNVVGMMFFRKYIWSDPKFTLHYEKLVVKMKCGKCFTYFVLIVALIFSHKWLQILFSNLFQIRFFTYKVDSSSKLTPLNYLRYISVIVSALAITGACIANYQSQPFQMNSIVFIQSVDLIIVSILSAICSLWITIRRTQDYQSPLVDNKYDMEEELGHQPVAQDVFHLQQQKNQGNNMKKYVYKSSMMKTVQPRDDPISKRNGRKVNPLGEENNQTGVPLDVDMEDNRLDLNSIKIDTRVQRMNIPKGEDQQFGVVEESGDNMIPSKRVGRTRPIKEGNNSKNVRDSMNVRDSKDDKNEKDSKNNPKNINENKSKDISNSPNSKKKNIKNAKQSKNGRYSEPQLQSQTQKQKEKLKQNIQTKLTPTQIEQTKVVKQADSIDTTMLQTSTLSQQSSQHQLVSKNINKNQLIKQKLDLLDRSSQQDLNRLSEGDREKADEMRKAVSLLKGKKVGVEQYLQYLDIIQQEDQDRDSDQYDNKAQNKNRRDDRIKNRHRKNKVNKGNSMNTKNIPAHKVNKSVQKVDRSAKLSRIDDLFINDTAMHDTFGDQQPQPASFDTPIRPRQRSQVDVGRQGQRMKNKSQVHYNKQKSNDMVMISLQSGDHYQKSLGDQFQRGNVLRQAQRDQVPPSNFYTQKLKEKRSAINTSGNLPKDRIVPNKLINDQHHIQFLQSQGGQMETVKDQLVDFGVAERGEFNQPNSRISQDGLSEAPTKPRFNRVRKQENKDQVLQVQDIQDIDQIQDIQQELQREMPSKLQRYQSNQAMLDYDEIMYQKRNNDRMKQLERIYLPRIEVGRADRKRRGKEGSSMQGRQER